MGGPYVTAQSFPPNEQTSDERCAMCSDGVAVTAEFCRECYLEVLTQRGDDALAAEYHRFAFPEAYNRVTGAPAGPDWAGVRLGLTIAAAGAAISVVSFEFASGGIAVVFYGAIVFGLLMAFNSLSSGR
jgi:hypothetical protein